MIKKYLLPFCLILMKTASAQTTAADWTLADCDSGTDHNLYTYLNNEEVVIMEFGMGCASCSDPATTLIDIRDSYDVSNPGKVKLFYLDYWTGNTCSDVIPAFGVYDYDALFAHCLIQKNYYFVGSPMPGIVIAAGSNHNIIYEKLSFTDSDTVAIKTAIDSFFMTVSVHNLAPVTSQINIYPNPSNSCITIDAKDLQQEVCTVSVIDAAGKILYQTNRPAWMNNQVKMDVSTYEKGMYSVIISTKTKSICRTIIIN